MYRVLTGKQRSLVFPVMCNGHVKIDYYDNIAIGADASIGSSDDVIYGPWSLDDAFTIEATVTPYDINGFGRHSVGSLTGVATDSGKVMPAIDKDVTQTDYISNYYLAETAKHTHEMRIFHSSKAQLSLINTTLHNENQPAEYKIKFSVTLGTTTQNLETSALILPSSGINWPLLSHTSGGQYGSGILDSKGKYTHVFAKTTKSSGNSGTTLVFLSTANNILHEDQELFIQNGFGFTSIGKVAATPSSSSGDSFAVTLDTSQSTALNSTNLFIKAPMNPSYVDGLFHIAATYDSDSKIMKIYFNNSEVASATHSGSGTFAMDKEDLFLGANGSGATGQNSATTNKQFMGEFHEFAMSRGTRNKFNVNNLTPRFADTVLYFRFEEIDQ